MSSPRRTPAVGGTRDVPVPDPVARDYLLLALRLDQHLPGTVDGYFGPADLKAAVDMGQPRSPARLADDAAALRQRVAGEVPEPERRHWLDLQLIALETLARVASGEVIPYAEQVARCFAHAPVRRPPARFEQAARDLAVLLPGTGTLADRIRAEDEAWIVGSDHVPAVADALVGRFRARAAALYGGGPDGEGVRIATVRDQPWGAYNWYDGGYRSRIDINLDLPIGLPALVRTIAHEAYPGHHLEQATKERLLVEAHRWLEASILLINTPECFVSEGLANAGQRIVVPADESEGLLLELAPVAGLAASGDAGAVRERAARQAGVAAARSVLAEATVNAALMLHEDGEPRDRVLEFLMEIGRSSAERATKQLAFIEQPLWRLYTHVYPDGEALIGRWLDVVAEGERPARFGRLLREQLTPTSIRAEIEAAAG